MTLLTVENLGKSFGKLRAVSDLNLAVEQGEIRCIIGPNGAGKTTLFNLLTGLIKPDQGKVTFAGEDITGLEPRKIVKKKISRSFQISNIYTNLTVYQNIRVAILSDQKRSHIFYKPVSSILEVNKKVEEVLEAVHLFDQRGVVADKLSHGDRRKLELGIVLSLEPRLLLLDEPTAGMNATETDEAIKLIKDLVRRIGLTLLLTEHDMKVVFTLADTITFMHYGKVLCEGEPQEIRDNEVVKNIYLGGETCRF